MATIYQREVVVKPLKFTAFDCPDCGVPYALTEDFEARRRRDGQRFFCPNGHGISFDSTAAAELKKAQEAAAVAQERLNAERGWSAQLEANLETERKNHAATKGQLTKTRSRVQAGVCPDCRRHFENVERHMKTRHKSGGIVTDAKHAVVASGIFS